MSSHAMLDQDGPRGSKIAARPIGGAALACALLALFGCGREIREALPFLPQSKYVDVGGRKLTRREVRIYQKIKDLSTATKTNPNDAVAYNSLGEIFQARGNYVLASQLYVTALKLDPTLSEANHNLGILALNRNLYGDAVKDLRKAIRLSPDDARIRHRLGLAYAGLRKYGEAFASYDEAIRLDNEYTPAYLDKARLLYRRRRYQQAEAVCRKALENLPPKTTRVTARESKGTFLDSILPKSLLRSKEDIQENTWAEEAHFDLALCLKAQGRLREGLAVLAGAETAKDGRADVQILRSRLKEGLGDLPGAIATLEALRAEFPERAEIPKRLARLYSKNHQPKRAAQARLEAAELDHSDRRLQLEAAQVAVAAKDTARAIAIYERLVRIDPNDLPSRRALARAYDAAGIQRQAALSYQEIVSRQPNDWAARRRLGMLYADLPGFQGRAVLQFKAVLEQNPKDTEVHRRLGQLYLQSRNFTLAERHIRWTLALDPNDAVAHQNLATLYALQKRGEDAVEEYRHALKLKPDLAEAQLNLAKVLLGIDHREEAVAPLEAYLKLKPLDPNARRLYADTLRDLNRREAAVQEYEAIIALRPKETATAMELAKLATLLGKRTEAAGMYESLLERNPANLAALKAAGRLYEEMNQPLRAMYCWQRVLKLRPADLDAQDRLAAIYKSIGDEDAAIKMYKQLGHAEAWRNMAFLFLKRGQREKAIRAYRKVIELNKRDVEARRALASLLQHSKSSFDRDEAVRLYQELLQLNANDPRARLNLANLYSEENRLAQAQAQYEALLRAQPKNAAARLGLGVIHRKRGKYQEASGQYQKALEANPNARQAHYNLAVLYDYYLDDPARAAFHYQRFVELGGDAARLPRNRTRAKPDVPAVTVPVAEASAEQPAARGKVTPGLAPAPRSPQKNTSQK